MNRQPTRTIRISHLNIQSLNNKIDQLKNYLATSRIDIMSINETWLKPTTTLAIDNYRIVRNDRLQTGGGGVCLITHNSICFSTISIPGSIGTESVTVRLHDCIRGKKDLIITSFYNPPNNNINPVFLKSVLDQDDHVLILGDLNAHHPAWLSDKTNNSGDKIYELLSENKIVMLNNEEPTYEPQHRPDYKAIIDFALCTEQLYPFVNGFDVTDELRSDHLNINLAINTRNNNYVRAMKETKTVEKINWDKFRTSIKNTNISDLKYSNARELDSSVESFTNTIQRVVNESTETKQVTYNPDYHLKLPSYIVKVIKEKRQLERQWKSNRCPILKRQLNKLKETIDFKIKEHKRNKWQTFCTSLNDHRVSDTILWKKLKTIEESNQEKPPKIPTLINNGKTTSDARIVAQIFANQQEAIFTEPNDQAFDQDFKEQVDNHHPHLFNYESGKEPEYTTEEEVNEQIKSLRTRGAPGPDKITNAVLKCLPKTFRKELVEIINASMRLQHVPKIWKEATVVMLPKPMKDHKQPENFRPISLLNTLSKLLERIILVRLRTWIATNELLSKYQCGFRHNRQTKDQILRIIQEALKAFNMNEYMGAIFIDIEKAFDKVWHNGLLHTLDEQEIPAYLGKWIQSYLTGRYFKVRIGKIFSEIKQIEAGVPQGSVLGPILFNLFFNKVSFSILEPEKIGTEIRNKLAELAMFADDLAAWARSRRLKEINSKLQQVLDNIEEWMNKWRMKVSTSKTVCTVFNKGGKNLGNKLSLTYKQASITSDSNPKFLGVTLDPALRLNKHTDIITNRAKKRLNMIKSIRGKNWGASSKLAITTYKVLVRPLIEYVPFITLLLPETNYMKMERIQREALRNAYYWAQGISTTDMYKQHNMESIKDRAIKLTDRYIYKAYHTNLIIKELIDEYNTLSEFDEGAYCKTQARKTILGKVKEFNTVSKQLLLSTTQAEQMDFYQENFLISDMDFN